MIDMFIRPHRCEVNMQGNIEGAKSLEQKAPDIGMDREMGKYFRRRTRP
jgi:hypothetical protein